IGYYCSSWETNIEVFFGQHLIELGCSDLDFTSKFQTSRRRIGMLDPRTRTPPGYGILLVPDIDLADDLPVPYQGPPNHVIVQFGIDKVAHPGVLSCYRCIFPAVASVNPQIDP